MKISQDQAKHIADLIQLDISGEEEKYAEILSDALDVVAVLDELDTSDVEVTSQVTGLINVYQTEGPSASLTKEEALSNASAPEDDLFGAPAVFER